MRRDHATLPRARHQTIGRRQPCAEAGAEGAGDDGGPRLTLPSLFRRACLGVLLLAGPDCRAAEPELIPSADTDAKDQSIRDAGTDPIGTATMLDDGTILLQLRAASPGVLGDALLRYAPADPRYGAVRDHLPGLRPGGAVAVPPFP